MPAYLGSSALAAAYLGDTALTKIYLGTTEVWSAAPPVSGTITATAKKTTASLAGKKIYTGTIAASGKKAVASLAGYSGPVYDNKGSIRNTTNYGVTTIQWSQTIAGNAAVVFIGNWAFGAGVVPTSVAIGASSMGSAVDSVTDFFTTAGYYMSIFAYRLLNPPQGSQTFQADFSANSMCSCSSQTYKNVSSFGNTKHNNGTGAPSDTFTSATNRIVANAINNMAATSLSNYSQTERNNLGYQDYQAIPLVTGDAPGAASITFSADPTGNGWGSLCVEMI